MKSADVSTPPGTRLALEFDRSLRQSLAPSSYRQLRAFLVEVALLSTSAKNRFGCRHKDCRAPFHYGYKLFILAATTLYPDTAPSSRCRARLHIGMSGNLRLLFFLRNATKALKRLPSRRCRSASLPPTLARTPYQSHVALSPQATKATSRLPTHRGSS